MDDMIRRVPIKFGDEAPSAPPLPNAGGQQPAAKPKKTIQIRDGNDSSYSAGMNFKPLTTIRPTLQPEAQEPKGPEMIDQPDDMGIGEEDAPAPEIKDLPVPQPQRRPRRNFFQRFFGGYWRHKLWAIPLTVLLLAGACAALPQSRYPILALFMSRSFTIEVIDSTTNTPVTGATVKLDGTTTQTGSTGKAYITAKVGQRSVEVSKKYYQDNSQVVFVGIATGSGHNTATVHLTATGRQVPVTVTDKITGKALSNVAVRVLDTEARTDADGKATLVLPTTSDTQAATLSADGYTTLSAKVKITSDAVGANTFALVPAGRVYFLSNQSGNIDVVSTNLDGTGRKTILDGTGSEDQNNTVLLASRDWQYLALLSKRDGGKNAKLYLIKTKDGSLQTMDSSNAIFSLVGWSNHTFVYQADDASKDIWDSGKTAIKSYNAESGATATIDKTTAQGDSTSYTEQNIGFVNLVNDRVVYGFAWNTPQTGPALGSNKNAMYSAAADGTGKKDLRDITPPAGTTYSGMYAVLVNPNELYIQSSTESQPDVFYSYKYQNNSVTQSDTITSSSFTQAQQSNITYLASPSGNATFWSQARDGKNTLFVGDYAGLNGDQIATASEYAPYGWYSDKYLLVQKGGSELYVMPVAGGPALKISDYYKPQYSYYGYGGGYGGL